MNFTDTLEYTFFVDLFLIVIGFVFFCASDTNKYEGQGRIFRIGSLISFVAAGIVTILVAIKFVALVIFS